MKNRQGIVTSAKEQSTQWNKQSYDKGGFNQFQHLLSDFKPCSWTVEKICSIQEKSVTGIQTLKIACSVRRWRSVKTKRGFLAWDPETGGSSSEASLFLHTEKNVQHYTTTYKTKWIGDELSPSWNKLNELVWCSANARTLSFRIGIKRFWHEWFGACRI